MTDRTDPDEQGSLGETCPGCGRPWEAGYLVGAGGIGWRRRPARWTWSGYTAEWLSGAWFLRGSMEARRCTRCHLILTSYTPSPKGQYRRGLI